MTKEILLYSMLLLFMKNHHLYRELNYFSVVFFQPLTVVVILRLTCARVHIHYAEYTLYLFIKNGIKVTVPCLPLVVGFCHFYASRRLTITIFNLNEFCLTHRLCVLFFFLHKRSYSINIFKCILCSLTLDK